MEHSYLLQDAVSAPPGGKSNSEVYYRCLACSECFYTECDFLMHSRTVHCKVLVCQGHDPGFAVDASETESTTSPPLNIFAMKTEPEDDDFLQTTGANTSRQAVTNLCSVNAKSCATAFDYSEARSNTKAEETVLTGKELSTVDSQFTPLSNQSTLSSKQSHEETHGSETACSTGAGLQNIDAVPHVVIDSAANYFHDFISDVGSSETTNINKMISDQSFVNVADVSKTAHTNVQKWPHIPKTPGCISRDHSMKVDRCGPLSTREIYECNYCVAIFSQPSSLQQHHLHHHSNSMTEKQQYQCNTCGVTFEDSTTLKAHEGLHQDISENSTKSAICNAEFPNQTFLNIRKRMHKTKTYTCEFCNAAFSDRSNMKRHRQNHLSQKNCHCVSCGAEFSSPWKLKRHKKTHSEDRPYRCDVCFAGFNDSSNLKRHKRIHTGEKPYVCHFCGAAFNVSSNLKSHVRHIHSEIMSTAYSVMSKEQRIIGK